MCVVKCKMCGGDMHISADRTVAQCAYCGTVQTIPNGNSEKKLALFRRANRLRHECEFDKAAGIYEAIVSDNPEEAEAYWGLVLCSYGIVYVDDPATGKKIPTCHRPRFEDVLSDQNYKLAMQYADSQARIIYCEEANFIEKLRQEIIAISSRELPCDIFICCKEMDQYGSRTADSLMAQDAYDALTNRGFQVFFARVSLEDKLGTEYEPYIFSALNSAAIMLVFGTDCRNLNSAWVKNEWSRYLKLMVQDKSRHLIPCYKGMDVYEMPREFIRLQAQDMGKVGAMQDLLHGIEKLLSSREPVRALPKERAFAGSVSAASLVKRGAMALEDQVWDTAHGFFDRALDIDVECAEAYLGKALADFKTVGIKQLESRLMIDEYTGPAVKIRIMEPDLQAQRAMAQKYAVPGYLEAEALCQQFNFDFTFSSSGRGAEEAFRRIRAALDENTNLLRAEAFGDPVLKKQIAGCRKAVFFSWEDAVLNCRHRDKAQMEKLRQDYAQYLQEKERIFARKQEDALKQSQKAEKRKRAAVMGKALFAFLIVAVLGTMLFFWSQTANNETERNYQAAEKMADSGNDAEAIAIFEGLGDYEDAAERALALRYSMACDMLQNGDAEGAAQAFAALGDYADAPDQVLAARYETAHSLYRRGEYFQAMEGFLALAGFRDSDAAVEQCRKGAYQQALALAGREEYAQAVALFEKLGDYKNAEIFAEKYHWYVCEPGDILIFGRYEQDNNRDNGKEEAQWVVLAREEERILAVSKYILDAAAFHTSERGITWENGSLRRWLNDDFLKDVFVKTEQERLIQTKIHTQDSASGAKGGKETTDRVFLLSAEEITRYEAVFSGLTADGKAVQMTAYAQARQERKGECQGSDGCWWTRSPAVRQDRPAYVDDKGNLVMYKDGYACNCVLGIRPAIWIKLER